MCKKRKDYVQMLKVSFRNAKENYFIINVTSREITI